MRVPSRVGHWEECVWRDWLPLGLVEQDGASRLRPLQMRDLGFLPRPSAQADEYVPEELSQCSVAVSGAGCWYLSIR